MKVKAKPTSPPIVPLLFYVAFLTGVFMVSGCGSSKPSYQKMSDNKFSMNKYTEGIIPAQYGQRLMALEGPIAQTLILVNERVGRLPSGQVQIESNLNNPTGEENLWFDWKVAFYDQSNYLVEQTEWQTTHFPANQVTPLKVNSISPNVQNYTIVLRIPPSSKNYEAAMRAAEMLKLKELKKQKEEEARQQAEQAQQDFEETQQRAERFAQTMQKMAETQQQIRNTMQGPQ